MCPFVSICAMPYVTELPSGRWRVIVKHNGRRRTATADTRSGVLKLGAKLLLDMSADDGDFGRRRTPTTVADLIGHYMATRESEWSPGYLADIEAVADRIPERFTARRAATVGTRDIEALYQRLANDGWSPHRRRRLHELLSAAWREGQRAELVDRSPVERARKPAARRKELSVPTDDQVAAILAAVDGVERLALRIAATLGIRRGEIVALQWRDLVINEYTDPETGERRRDGSLTIRRSLRYSPAAGVVEGETKTGVSAHRVLALDDQTFAMLLDWRDHVFGVAAEAALDPRWIFTDDGGVTAWRPDRLTHIFDKARKAAKVTGVRLHDLRHYVATSMLYDGLPLRVVADQLGHTSEQTTANVYTHFLPGRGRESVNQRARRLG